MITKVLNGMALGMSLFAAATAIAATEPVSQPVPAKPATKEAHVRYKSGKDVDFEALLINGQLQRPEISVVTGDSGADGNGLLRLREDFVDQLAADAGEKQ